MAFKVTFTERFEKHYKMLSAQEKKQVKSRLSLLAKIQYIHHLERKKSRVQMICLSVVSIWIFVLFGSMRVIQ